MNNSLQSRIEQLEAAIAELKGDLSEQEVINKYCRWYRKEGDNNRAPGYELRSRDAKYLGYFGSTKYGSEEMAKTAMLQAIDAITRYNEE